MPQTPTRQRNIGLALALGSATLFALSNTLAGVAYEGGAGAISLTATRFILPIILLLVLLKATGAPVRLARRPAITALLLGIVSVIYTLSLMTAIALLPVAIAILIFYLYPIFTGFFLVLMGWVRPTVVMAISALAVFGGLALTLGVKFESLSVPGMIYGLVAAIGLGLISTVSNRLMVARDMRQATLYMTLSAGVIMVVVVLVSGEFQLPETSWGWTGFIASNVCYAFALIGFYTSISLIGAQQTTFFSNVEPVVTLITGFAFLGQVLAPLQLAGVAIVVIALVYVGRGRRDSEDAVTPDGT